MDIHTIPNSWVKLMSPNTHIKLNNTDLSNVVMPVLIMVFGLAIILLIWQYIEMQIWQHKLAKNKVNAYIKEKEHDRKAYNHYNENAKRYKFAINQSIFNANTSIIMVLIYTLWWWFSRWFLALGVIAVISIIIEVMGYVVPNVNKSISGIPLDLFITVVFGLIPIAIAVKRNKPQWLKLLLVISELIIILTGIIEWIML